MLVDKRKHPRIDSLSLLSYLCRDETGRVVQQGMGRTRNINQGGILLETHAPIDPHHFVYLAIHLKDQHIHVKGRIVHQIRRYDGKYESGIQFVEPDEMSLSVLTEFIAAFNRQE